MRSFNTRTAAETKVNHLSAHNTYRGLNQVSKSTFELLSDKGGRIYLCPDFLLQISLFQKVDISHIKRS